MDVKRAWGLVKGAASAWVDDYAPSMGAALAYYTMFSIAPLLLIVISIAGLVFGEEAARGEILLQLRGMMGEEGARTVESLLQSVSKPTHSAAATVVGAFMLLLGATTVLAELQSALDRIWRAPVRKPTSGLWDMLRSRLLSFGMILGIGFLLMVSLIASAAIAALGKWWSPVFEGWKLLASAVDFGVSLAMMTVLFAMIYKLMPRVHIRWRDVWIGAAVTALLFDIGKFLIGLYIGRSSVASTFGAAGSLVVVLMWIYYSAQIFLLGAEFTWVYAHTYGSRKGKDTAPAADTKTAPSERAVPGNPGAPSAVPMRSGSA